MQEEYINISTYCSSHQLDFTFIEALEEEGLLEITIIGEIKCIPTDQLHDLERYTRWYTDLGINAAGIDVIRHLLQRIRMMQEEMLMLRNRLHMYE